MFVCKQLCFQEVGKKLGKLGKATGMYVQYVWYVVQAFLAFSPRCTYSGKARKAAKFLSLK